MKKVRAAGADESAFVCNASKLNAVPSHIRSYY